MRVAYSGSCHPCKDMLSVRSPKRHGTITVSGPLGLMEVRAAEVGRCHALKHHGEHWWTADALLPGILRDVSQATNEHDGSTSSQTPHSVRSLVFCTLLLCCHGLSLPLSSQFCKCGSSLDVPRHHRAACARAREGRRRGLQWGVMPHESAEKLVGAFPRI